MSAEGGGKHSELSLLSKGLEPSPRLTSWVTLTKPPQLFLHCPQGAGWQLCWESRQLPGASVPNIQHPCLKRKGSALLKSAGFMCSVFNPFLYAERLLFHEDCFSRPVHAIGVLLSCLDNVPHCLLDMSSFTNITCLLPLQSLLPRDHIRMVCMIYYCKVATNLLFRWCVLL